MLNLQWAELEVQDGYGAGVFGPVESEVLLFKRRFFDLVNSTLDWLDSPEVIIDKVTDAIKRMMNFVWENLNQSHVMFAIEAVLDYVLCQLDLPGPDIVVRLVVKKALLKISEELVQRQLKVS